MTKSLLRIIVLTTGLLVGLLQLPAQSRDKIEPFYPEVRALCDSVLSYSSTPDKMKEPFILLLRKYGSNADQMYRAAEYFAGKDNYSCSQFCIERAFGKKMKNTEILQLRAQIYERVGNTALASNSYDGILQVDSLNHYALMKAADVDKYQNAAASMERLLLVKEKYPDDIEADKQLGYHYNRLAFEASRDSTIKANWRLSVQHYGNWFFATPVDSLNKSDFYCNQYITNLYNIEATKKDKKDSKDGKGEVKDFDKLVQVCNILEPHITRPVYSKNIKAYKFWGLVQAKDSEKAHAAMSYLSQQTFPDSLYQYLDYAFAGQLYADENNLPEAIKWQKKAVEMYPEKCGARGYYTLYDYYNRNEQYKDAAPAYRQFMTQAKEEKAILGIRDTMYLGILYTNLARNAKREKNESLLNEYVKSADSIYAYVSEKDPSIAGPVARAELSSLLDAENDISLTTKNHYDEAIRRIDSLRIVMNDEFYNMNNKIIYNNYVVTYYMYHGTNEEIVGQILKYDDEYDRVKAFATVFGDNLKKANNEDAKYFIDAYYFAKKLIDADPSNKYRTYNSSLKNAIFVLKEEAEKQQRILEEKEAEEAALRAAEEAALKMLEEQEAAAKAEAERIAAEKAEAEKKAAEEAAAAAAQATTEAAATATEEVKAAEEATDKKSKKKKSKKQKVEAEAEAAAPTATEGTQTEEPKAESKADKKSKKKKNKKAAKQVEQTEEDKAKTEEAEAKKEETETKAEETEVKTEDTESKKEEPKAEEEKSEEPAQEKTEEEVKE